MSQKNRVERLEGVFSPNAPDAAKLAEQTEFWDCVFLYYLGRELIGDTPEWKLLESCSAYQRGEQIVTAFSPSEQCAWEEMKKNLLEDYDAKTFVFYDSWKRQLPDVRCSNKIIKSVPMGLLGDEDYEKRFKEWNSSYRREVWRNGRRLTEDELRAYDAECLAAGRTARVTNGG